MKVQRQESTLISARPLRLIRFGLAAAVVGSVGFLLHSQYSSSGASLTVNTPSSLLLLGSSDGSSSVRRVTTISPSTSNNNNNLQATTSTTTTLFPYDDALSCDTVDARLHNGTWKDPNEGMYNVRQVLDPPRFKISVHKRDYDWLRFDTIYTDGRYYEHKVKKRFDLILSQTSPATKKNGLVVDIGANVGYYTMVAAAYQHRVVSFEINPANLIRLCESLSINRFNEQVAIYQRGVSSVANQPLTVVIPESNPGMAHLGKANNATNDGVVDADADSVTLHSALTTTVTLDQFAQDHGWYDLPDFTIPLLKLDIEGHEPNVVKGAKKLLCSGIIQNILTEFNQMERTEAQTAIQTLMDCGYVAVHQEGKTVVKKTKAETKPYLKEIDEWGKKTRQNIDLWFQLDESNPVLSEE